MEGSKARPPTGLRMALMTSTTFLLGAGVTWTQAADGACRKWLLGALAVRTVPGTTSGAATKHTAVISN